MLITVILKRDKIILRTDSRPQLFEVTVKFYLMLLFYCYTITIVSASMAKRVSGFGHTRGCIFRQRVPGRLLSKVSKGRNLQGSLDNPSYNSSFLAIATLFDPFVNSAMDSDPGRPKWTSKK